MSISANELRGAYRTAVLKAGQAVSRIPMGSQTLSAILLDNADGTNSQLRINTNSVRAAVEMMNAQGGTLDAQVLVEYRKRVPFTNTVLDDFCQEAPTTQKGVTPFRISKQTEHSVSVAMPFCNTENYQIARQAALIEGMNEFNNKLVAQFNTYFFGGLDKFVGLLPKLTEAGAPRARGTALPLYHAATTSYPEPRPNSLGAYELQRDRELLGINSDEYVIATPAAVQMLKNHQALSGYSLDFADVANTNLAAMGSAARNIYSSMALSSVSGYAKGLLVVPAGHLKLVTLAINTPEYGVAADLGTHVRMVMRNPAFGFNVDVIANLKTCAKDGVRETFTFRVYWDVFAMPQCDTGDPRLEGTNGLRLYNITCSEDTICDIGVEGYVETAELVDSEVCEELDIETCTPTCSVYLVRGTETDTTVTYFAIATPSHGAIPKNSELVWEVDGVEQIGVTSAALTLVKADLTDGDVIEITVTDELGCIATASITYNV
jgi:hypothetical protein